MDMNLVLDMGPQPYQLSCGLVRSKYMKSSTKNVWKKGRKKNLDKHYMTVVLGSSGSHTDMYVAHTISKPFFFPANLQLQFTMHISQLQDRLYSTKPHTFISNHMERSSLVSVLWRGEVTQEKVHCENNRVPSIFKHYQFSKQVLSFERWRYNDASVRSTCAT